MALNFQTHLAYEEYVGLGGSIHAIDEHWEAQEPHIFDEDGEIAREAQMSDWAASENCPEWAR